MSSTRKPLRTRPTAERLPVIGALALITLAGFAIRAQGMGQGLFGDELFAWWETWGVSLTGVLDQVKHGLEVTPPLFFLLARAAERFGDPAVTIRLPSLLAGTLLIPLVFLLAGRLGRGRAVQLTAAAATAVNVTAIFYSTEARPYALVSMLTAVSTLSLLGAVSARERPWAWWTLYAISSALVVYTHYSGVWVLVAQAGWAAFTHRDRLRPLIAANLAAALMFVPWLGQALDMKRAPAMFGPLRFDPGGWLDLLLRQLLGFPFAIAFRDIPGLVALVVMAACLIVAIGAFALALLKRTVHAAGGEGAVGSERGTTALIWLLIAATPIGMILASLVTGSNLIAVRYLSASLPFLLIALAVVLNSLGQRSGIVLSCLFLLAGSVGALKLLEPSNERPDTRAAARLIDARLPQTAVIADAFLPPNGVSPLGPYLRDATRTPPDPWRLRSTYEGYFERAAKAGEDVAVAYTNCPAYARLIDVPPAWAKQFVQVGQYAWPGLSCGIGVRLFRVKGG